jgi:hypothetical protein
LHIQYVASDVNKQQQPARDMGTKNRDSSEQSIQPALSEGAKKNSDRTIGFRYGQPVLGKGKVHP